MAAVSEPFERVGIVGGGFMGSGIAESVARASIEVLVHEPEDEPLERSRDRVAASAAKAVEGGKLDAAEADALCVPVWPTRTRRASSIATSSRPT